MKRNIVGIGSKEVSGDFNWILEIGELVISDSEISKVYTIGDMSLNNCSIKKIRCIGEIEAEKTDFGNAKLIGEVTLNGLCTAEYLKMSGILTAELLVCRVLVATKANADDLQGIWKWKGTFEADTFEVLATVLLEGEGRFKNIIVSESLSYSDEIMCESFYSFGALDIESINGENVTILIHKGVKVQNLVGTNIRIVLNFSEDKRFKQIPKSKAYSCKNVSQTVIDIPYIDGDYVDIVCTKSKLVAGVDVVIGDLCIIDRVEYRNSIQISDKAVVNEVVRL